MRRAKVEGEGKVADQPAATLRSTASIARRLRRLAVSVSALIALAGSLPRPARAEEAAQAIAPAFDKLERAGTPKATYDANTYDVVHVEVTAGGTLWDTKSVWWRPVRGIYRFPNSYIDFYRALGRPDLAEQAESRHAKAQALFCGGVIMAVGGLLGGSYALYKGNTVGAIVGAWFLVGGFVTANISATLSRPVLPESAAEDMAARYNRALGQHLGLSVAGDF